jgi:hypothetical protein
MEDIDMVTREPSDKEEEYFLKLNQEKIKKLRSDLDKKREEESKQKRKEATWMKCPKCGADLKEVNYQNVMIDTCSQCQGIWLDHGELELLAQGHAEMSKGFLKKLFR